MNTKFAGLFVIGLLALTGCTQSDANRASKLCEEEIRNTVAADKLEIPKINAGSLSDLLFETGDSKERDHSKNVLMATTEVRAWEGSIEKKITTVCSVTIENGDVTEVKVSTL